MHVAHQDWVDTKQDKNPNSIRWRPVTDKPRTNMAQGQPMLWLGLPSMDPLLRTSGLRGRPVPRVGVRASGFPALVCIYLYKPSRHVSFCNIAVTAQKLNRVQAP